MMLALLIGSFLLAQNVYSPADFISVSGDSLKARFDNAVARGKQDNAETFWIAYEMSQRPNEYVTTVDGIDVIRRNTPERTAMFFLVRKSDAAIDKLRIVGFDEMVRVHDRKVYWLGMPSSDDSAKLLLDIARTSPSAQVKKEAVFWLGMEVSRSAGSELETLANTDPEVEVQKQAVFALSQRRSDESIPTLMRIAKEHPNAAVRKQAIFWLGQKRDPRVLDFFEQLLR